MDPQLRLMALQLAVEWSKTLAPDKYATEQDIINAAKTFVDYVEGSGLAATPFGWGPPDQGPRFGS